MQEFDHAIKTVATLKPNTALDLAFGKQRTIKVQRKLLTQPPNQKLREGLMAATILVDIRVFGMKIVEAEFTKKELNMLKKTSLVQGWLNDSEIKGRQEGKREGRQEGRQEGKLSVVEILLKQKLGVLSPRLRGQLQKLDGKKLDRLTLRLQQMSNRRDLQAWLKNGASRHVSR